MVKLLGRVEILAVVLMLRFLVLKLVLVTEKLLVVPEPGVTTGAHVAEVVACWGVRVITQNVVQAGQRLSVSSCWYLRTQ